ncbi:16345_t:CDS:10 [Funneliformis geosporum]|uniref:Lysophospholipase n=1 Tax=Funneliformis geosporum TaxID=1117311 RepID=A0A9W4SM09_9GLOM|nr:16345_t:CDS:10 [Funneliformis geosporum]
MSMIADSLLLSTTSITSIIILAIQKYKINFYSEPDVRFSTARKDYIKLALSLCQVALFLFLLFVRIFHVKNLDEKEALHAGLLAFCWIYFMIMCLLICFTRARNWKWILNVHVTLICVTASLAATWQLRTALVFRHDTRELIIAIINLVNSTIIAAVAITTPKGPPTFKEEGRSISSINHCSIWEFITFSMTIPLIRKSFKTNTLYDSDLDELPNEYLAHATFNKIKRWRSNKLLYRIRKANQKILLLETFFVILSSFLRYVPILFLYSLLDFIQENKFENYEWAIFCLFSILIGGLLHVFAVSQHQYWGCAVLQVNISSMLNSEIYSKSLTIKNNVNEIGKVSNLMAVDANRVSQFAIWWATILEGPIQIGVGLFFLYKLLESACLIGILVLVVILPIQRWSGYYFSINQERLMKARDYRVSLMSEVLQGIRMIKFNAWEDNWMRRILDARNIELKFLKKNFVMMSLFNLLWMASPILITVASFLTYTKILGNELTASVTFTSVVIFNEIRFILNDLAELFVLALQALVSLRRIEVFLTTANKIKCDKDVIFECENKIGFESATITWYKTENIEDNFIMKDLNIEFPIEKLSIIFGPTGSGKTLLLMALLGEAEIQSGKVFCPQNHKSDDDSDWIMDDSIAYVAQYTWLRNGSIRDSILFNLPFNEERYNQVVESCALDKDFESFVDGDLTEIGEQGVTLSGGQKQRIALARAVYSRAKHILIDDALSAVDANTAKHLINECLSGPLMHKRTRILVTNHLNLALSNASYMVAINNGQIAVKGEVSELYDSGSIFQFLKRKPEEYVSEKVIISETNPIENAIGTCKPSQIPSEGISIIVKEDSIDENITNKRPNDEFNKPRVLVQEEGKESGKIKLGVYLKYLESNGNYLFWIMALILFISTRTAQILEGWWLNEWSSSNKDLNIDYYIKIYIIIIIFSVFFGVVQFSFLYYGSLRASKKLYFQLLATVIKAPLRFFDTTPIGRILNRFSKDFEVIDSTLAVDLGLFLHNLLMMVGVIIVIITITKAAIIFAIIYVIIGALYAKISRELKRLDSITKSPLYSHYTETLIGLTTIRAFKVTEQFMSEMLKRIDDNIRPFYFLWVANRWLQIWTNGIGAFFPFVTGLFILLNLEKINASLAGLSLSFAMTFTSQIMWSIRKYTQLEMSLNSVERIIESLCIRQENYQGEIGKETLEEKWPRDGNIKFEGLQVKYAEDLEPVLHNISFEIIGKEKVGIVGRTGSGKSTMSLSIFRFLEATEGRILIDGIDISKLSLKDLRSNLTIIPQDPILFTEAINNLPVDQDFTRKSGNIFYSLDTQINEGGNNLSQGQRQLLCLARALLKKSKIIIMDEATASIDLDLDEKIQKMIKTEFNDCTIICIAHKLRTIMDYDKILVLGIENPTINADVLEKMETETKKTTTIVTEIGNDKDDNNETKLITETITTKTTVAESGKSWYTKIIGKFEKIIYERLPETLKYNQKVVDALDALKENISKKTNDSSVHPEIEWDAEVRCSNELCDDEITFLKERKEYIKGSFAKYIGVDVEEIHVDDIPVIAFAGSGGGFRAMIATTAYMRALQDSGLYDCGVYYSGLSGSCWNLATQYSSLCATKENPIQAVLEYFKEHLTHHIANPLGLLKALSKNSSPETAVELVFGGLVQKEGLDLPLHVIDVYGSLLSARLLIGNDPDSQHQDFKLSQQKRFLEGGKQMMPIYTAIYHERPWKNELDEKDAAFVENYEQVWAEYSKKKDHLAWYEFTPFEIGCDEQAAWIPTWAFGRKFELGKNLIRIPEQNFTPCAPIYIDIRQFEHFLPEGWLKTKWKKLYDGAMEDIEEEERWKFEGHHLIPTASNFNYMYHLNPPPYQLGLTNDPMLELIDAGASNDLPLYPLVHPSRKVDIIIGFDSSSQIIKHEYFEQEQLIFTSRKGITRVARDVENEYCEIYDYIPTGSSDGYTTPAAHPSIFCYLPFLPNEKVDKNFVPSTAKFASFANFSYTPEQIDLMVSLAKQNWLEAEEKVKGVIIDAWKKKRDARLSHV